MIGFRVLNKKALFLFIGFYFWFLSSNAQIKGIVTSQEGSPLESVVVSLMKLQDSALVKTTFTDSLGYYEFLNLKPDSYFLYITSIGCKPHSSSVVFFNDNNTFSTIPTIQLQASITTQLKEVSVESKLSFVEKKLDKTIVNPEALLANAGTNALEVLEKSPGVQVDVNGIISLRGKQGVQIYVDDKPTYLSAADLSTYLKSIPASMVGLIEIMTNPSAKYDAAGNAGVINIKLKKNKAKGFNGGISISYGQGFYPRSNNSVNFNYRIHKFNFFSSVGYSLNKSFQNLTIMRKYFDGNGKLNSAFTQNTFIKMYSNSVNAKLGVDYYINKKSTIGIVFSGFYNLYDNSSANNAIVSNEKSIPERLVTAFSPSKRIFKNGNINLNYNYKIDTIGQELTVNFDYLGYHSVQQQSLLSKTYLPDYTFLNRSNLVSKLPSNIQIGAIKIDYSKPFLVGIKLEAGVKSSYVVTDNIADFSDETNSVLTPNYDFSNHFKYKENINALYSNLSYEKNRFSIQAGLRYENTFIVGHQLGNKVNPDSSFVRKYNSFFPTFYLSYQCDSLANHQIGFSYGRRIDRPNYQDLNPFTYPLDRFTLYAGNTFLQPTFSNNFELSHTYKNRITTTLLFSLTKNMITETIEQNTNIFYSRPGNIGQQISYGVSVNGSIPAEKWWTVQFYAEVMHNSFKANLYNQRLNNSGTYFYFEATNQFSIGKTWVLELGGNYQTSIASAQFVLIPVGAFKAALAKRFYKNTMTLKLNISDVFYTNKPGGEIKSLYNSTASWFSTLDTRVLTLAFSYRFNKGESMAARKSGGTDSEKARVR